MLKMFLEILLLAVIIIILACLGFIFTRNIFLPSTQQNPLNSVCVKGKCFSVELAKTQAERERGLMFRAQLGKDKGVLFIFDEVGIYPFWMKNTLMPLDIIWADSQGKVVYISKDAQPCKSLICRQITPDRKAMYVLEINAGICDEIGLKIGDKLGINID